ncbi:MAG: hypothetical protein ABSH32_33045 [Bryobacteraceae bacterium]
MPKGSGIPDMRFINRELPIAEVARTLELRLDGASKIHCWHPERHQHGDRTASVGIRASNNTVKCFGCDSKPMGVIDLVVDVRGVGPADAALWIAERFTVPSIPARKRLADGNERSYRVGYERGLGLLIRSGLWARLSAPAQAIAGVLLEFGEKDRPLDETLRVQMAYRTLARFSGVQSHNAIRKGLVELGEVGFLVLPAGVPSASLDRKSATYIVTPNSHQLWELAQTAGRQMQQEIAAEVELRKRQRRERLCSSKGN